MDGTTLGRRLIEGLRVNASELPEDDPRWIAIDSLRWGADGVDDETLWQAVITAIQLAENDGERWMLGDGVVDESVATRPVLRARLRASYDSNPYVREMYRVMHAYLDDSGYDRGWWRL